MDKLSSEMVRRLASDVGFDLCGVTSGDPDETGTRQYRRWIECDMHGEMSYLARDLPRRTDPRAVLPGVRSLIMLGVNYYDGEVPEPEQGYGRVSRYAAGRDYHKVIAGMIKKLVSKLEQSAEPGAKFRSYVDHGPVMERTYAERAGLGFIGKNGMLINRQFGSWIFLATVFTTSKLDPGKRDPMAHGSCGTCRACLDACPTGAIVSPRRIDSRRCISYLTIERPSEIPDEHAERMSDWIFGCDICQDVCPHNAGPVATRHEQLTCRHGVGHRLSLDRISALETREQFLDLTAGTPLTRPRLLGLQRSAMIAQRNQQQQTDR